MDNEKRHPKTEGPAVRTALDHPTIPSYGYVFKYDNVTVNILIAYTESKHFVVADFSRDSGGLQSFTIALPVALFRLSATARKQQRRQQ